MNQGFLILAVVLMATGCSNKAMYENFQRNAQTECRELPEAQYQRCMERVDSSYEEYQRKRAKDG